MSSGLEHGQAAEEATFLHHRLRLSGILILLGLLVEAFSLLWAHPTAFLVFLLAGGLFLAGGILLFLHSLVAGPRG